MIFAVVAIMFVVETVLSTYKLVSRADPTILAALMLLKPYAFPKYARL